MPSTLTPATASDVDLLLELMHEFYQNEHLVFEEQAVRRGLGQILGNSAFGIIYIMTLDADLCGYVVLTFGFSLEFGGRTALVDELYVREEFRGRGVGRAALVQVDETCRLQSIPAVRLEVDMANTMALELYRRAGYVAHDRYLLTKWLAP